jgi:hypothetical protein
MLPATAVDDELIRIAGRVNGLHVLFTDEFLGNGFSVEGGDAKVTVWDDRDVVLNFTAIYTIGRVNA